jgi:hypothetical protein
MKLSCVLVACNENTHYLDFWPAVKNAWWEVVNVPCIMVYVGEELPSHLKDEPAVIHFKPIPNWPTATQAQVIRLLWPALLKGDGAVMLSDMDMIPMQSDWFHKGFEPFKENQFVSLRGIDEQEKQIYMCYVGASPQTWSHMFGIQTEQDVRNTMLRWSQQIQADGHHGGLGWCSDQQILYAHVKHWLQEAPDRIGLVPWTAQIPRLDRGNPMEWVYWSERLEEKIKGGAYVDFHMPPYKEFQTIIDRVLYYLTEPLSN